MAGKRRLCAALAALALGLAAAAAPARGEMIGPVYKRMAADFTVDDAGGEAVRLSDFEGTPVIVNFFASWCGPCAMEMPHFDAAYQEYEGRIQFLMVDMNAFGNDTAEAATAMIEEGGYAFPIYFDARGEAMLAHNVNAFPTTLFVAGDGELIRTQVGAMTEKALAEAIGELLETEPEA